MLTMSQVLCITVVLAGLCAVLSYPMDLEDEVYFSPDILESEGANAIYSPDIPEAYIYANPYQEAYVSKRSRTEHKRASLNALLRRLIALYGSNEIPFTGQSAHMRFGAGGR